MIATVRARLTLWHSGLLAALVLAFAVASYTFLRATELARIDSTLREQSEIVTQAMRDGGNALIAPDAPRIVAVLHDLRARGVRVWVFDAAERPLLSTTMVHEGEGEAEEARVLGDTIPLAAVRSAARAARQRGEAAIETVATSNAAARVFAAPLPADVGAGTVVVSSSLRDLDELLAHARSAAAVAVVLAIVLSTIAGYVLARRSLDPVAAMSHKAERIDAENLHERLPVANAHDELGALAATFNKLLDRVAGAFEQQRRFMADASHELRTPVAIMRGEAEVALSSDDRPREAYRDALVVVRDAADRLSRTVNDIFLLARVDASQAPTTPVRLYLDDVVADTCRAVRSLAVQRRIDLECQSSGEIPYEGDETLLQRLVLNLVDNAIKYSAPGGVVRVCLAAEPGVIRLRVTNGGPGIPPEAQPHVFERFFRVDRARTGSVVPHAGGSGLGLAIARWIAELHGGRLSLTESNAERTIFTLELPVEPALRAVD